MKYYFIKLIIIADLLNALPFYLWFKFRLVILTRSNDTAKKDELILNYYLDRHAHSLISKLVYSISYDHLLSEIAIFKNVNEFKVDDLRDYVYRSKKHYDQYYTIFNDLTDIRPLLDLMVQHNDITVSDKEFLSDPDCYVMTITNNKLKAKNLPTFTF